MGLLVRPAGRTSLTDQLAEPAGWTSWMAHFSYLKIDLSVCTLLQLPSLTNAMFLKQEPLIVCQQKQKM